MTNRTRTRKSYLNEPEPVNNCVKCKFNSCARVYLAAMEGMTEFGIGCDTFKVKAVSP